MEHTESTGATGATVTMTNPPAEGSFEGFDFVQHNAALEAKADGLWVDMGPMWGHMVLRIRPFDHSEVMAAREAAEEDLRITLGKMEGETLPADQSLIPAKSACAAAITGAKVRFKASPQQLEIARREGWEIDGPNVVVLKGTEKVEPLQGFFDILTQVSNPFMKAVIRWSRKLQAEDDKRVLDLGKDFVYGRPGGADSGA